MPDQFGFSFNRHVMQRPDELSSLYRLERKRRSNYNLADWTFSCSYSESTQAVQ